MDEFGFFIGFTFNWLDILWIVVFGVLIDADHIPFGRLWQDFQSGGLKNVLAVFKRDGWFDPNHKSFFHNWPGLVSVIIISVIAWNLFIFLAYAIHIAIDGGVIESETSPLIYFLSRRYPEWARYHSKFALAHPKLFRK